MDNISRVVEEDIKRVEEKMELIIQEYGNPHLHILLENIEEIEDEIEEKKSDIFRVIEDFANLSADYEPEGDNLCQLEESLLVKKERVDEEKKDKIQSIVELIGENRDIMRGNLDVISYIPDDSKDEKYVLRPKHVETPEGYVNVESFPPDDRRRARIIVEHSDEITSLLNKAKKKRLSQKIQMRNLYIDTVEIINRGRVGETPEIYKSDSILPDSEEEACDEIFDTLDSKHRCFGKRSSQFDFGEIRDFQKEISELVSENYDKVDDLRDGLVSVICAYIDYNRRETIDKDITIRDDEIYAYSSSNKATFGEIISAAGEICQKVDGNKKENLKEFFQELDDFYSFIYSIQLMGEVTPTEWAELDYFGDYVIPIDEGYYIYYSGEDIVFGKGCSELEGKEGAIRNLEERERIDFLNASPEDVARIDYLPAEKTGESLEELKEEIEERATEFDDFYSNFIDRFDTVLVSTNI